MTPMPASPFLNSGAHVPEAPGSAAADQVAPQVAAAELLSDFAEASAQLADRETAVALQAACPGATAEQIEIAPSPDLISEHAKSAVASSDLQPRATAELIPASTGGPQEAPAPRCTEPHKGAGALDHIPEIFHWVRKLMKDDVGFVLDEAAFMADVEEIPLFIREDGYLKRQA